MATGPPECPGVRQARSVRKRKRASGRRQNSAEVFLSSLLRGADAWEEMRVRGTEGPGKWEKRRKGEPLEIRLLHRERTTTWRGTRRLSYPRPPFRLLHLLHLCFRAAYTLALKRHELTTLDALHFSFYCVLPFLLEIFRASSEWFTDWEIEDILQRSSSMLVVL